MQRAVLARPDEIDADLILPRVALRSILDRQLERVVLVVAADRDRARRRRHPRRDHVELVALLEERFVARVELQKRA